MGVLSAYNMLREPIQHVATYCNTLQRTATYHNTLQHGTRGDVLDVLSVCSIKSSGCQPRTVTNSKYLSKLIDYCYTSKMYFSLNIPLQIKQKGGIGLKSMM